MSRLRELLAKQDDPYAGVDLANAARIGGAVWFVGAAIAAMLLPFDRPDEAIGGGGWAVAAAVIVGSVALGIAMRRVGGKLNVTALLAFSYAGLAAIAAMVWLSGGRDSPYMQLFLLSVLYTCAIHPARRVVPYLGALCIATLLPLTYSDWSSDATVSLVTELVVWLALAIVVIYLMTMVRAQRLGLRREGEQARRQARLDPLTKLPNRRAFDESLTHAINRARASGRPLSVVLGDIDDFKDFNDRFGHLAGDQVLKAVAETVRAALRAPDAAYRWGGDEFAVVLPHADQRGAELVADRVRAAVARTTGPDGEPLTMKTGVAELDRDGRDSADALLSAADQALLRAKGSGTFEIPHGQG